MVTNDVDFGWWGVDGPGPGTRARVSWNADTGVLYLFHPLPQGDTTVALASIRLREHVDLLMGDWASLAAAEGLPGLRRHLADAGVVF